MSKQPDSFKADCRHPARTLAYANHVMACLLRGSAWQATGLEEGESGSRASHVTEVMIHEDDFNHVVRLGILIGWSIRDPRQLSHGGRTTYIRRRNPQRSPLVVEDENI